MTTDGWTEFIVGVSIFAPLIVTAVIVVLVLRGRKNDPDEQRLRAQQRAYEASKRE